MSFSPSTRPVKSWGGLGMGAFAVVVSLIAWFQSGHWTHLVAAAGFACFAIVWGQLPLSLTVPLRRNFENLPTLGRVQSTLAALGFALIVLALVLAWFP